MFGLSFLSPLFLAGIAAAAIPIAIHLFNRRTEPVIEFAAMRYLRRAPVEHSRRRRLRELLLLALRVAALCLLALAFARPYFAQSAAALAVPVTMVLVDTSLSMTAPGQFDRARKAALAAIDAAPPGSAVGVMTFAHGADVVAAPSQNRAGARAAIEKIQPGAGATRYRAALARAAETMGDRAGQFVVVTDLQQSGWDAADEGAVPDRVSVAVEDVGGPDGNLAVAGIRFEGAEAIALIRNYTNTSRPEQASFGLDSRQFASVPVTVPPGGTVEARASIEGRTRGVLTVSITDSAGYAADNTRYAVLDSAQAPSVLAVTATGRPADVFYFERAVLAGEDTGAFRFRSLSGPAFSAASAEELAELGAIVVLGTRGVDARGRDLLAGYVKSGGGLLIAAGPDVDPQVLRESLGGVVPTTLATRAATEPLRFAPADSRHPVFRLFGGVGTLSNVSFERSAAVQPSNSAEVIARYTDGSPALVEDRATGGRILIFASDLNNRWNDFPVQPAFVPFVHETLRYLAASRAPRADYVVGELPGAAGNRPGVVHLSAPEAGAAGGAAGLAQPVRRVAVNVDPRESDPGRITPDTFQAGITRLNAAAAQQARAQAREREESQRLWQFGLLLMIVSLAAEGMVGRRLG